MTTWPHVCDVMLLLAQNEHRSELHSATSRLTNPLFASFQSYRGCVPFHINPGSSDGSFGALPFLAPSEILGTHLADSAPASSSPQSVGVPTHEYPDSLPPPAIPAPSLQNLADEETAAERRMTFVIAILKSLGASIYDIHKFMVFHPS